MLLRLCDLELGATEKRPSARAAAAASMCRRTHLHCLPGWGYDHGCLAALACSGRRVWSHLRASKSANIFTWRALPRDDDSGSRDRDSQTAVWVACFYRCPGLAELPSALALVAEAPSRCRASGVDSRKRAKNQRSIEYRHIHQQADAETSEWPRCHAR